MNTHSRFWANRTNKVSGIAFLLIPVASVGGFLVGGSTGEIDPFARGEIEQLLTAIDANAVVYRLSVASFAFQDLILLPAAAAALYLSLRDRSPFLALLGTLGIVVGALALVLHLVGTMTLPYLADDLLRGAGQGSATSGHAAVLQSARTVSVVQGLAALSGQTGMGLGLLSYGTLLAWAPRGVRNPPRWLGFAGVVGGLSSWCTWGFLIDHTVGGVATLTGEAATMVMMVGLGIWFLRHPDT